MIVIDATVYLHTISLEVYAMAEIAFSIPVTGTIALQGDSLTIRIRETTITMKLEPEGKTRSKITLERGKTLFDVVLESARSYVEETGSNEFSAAEIYHLALGKHPDLNLKRNSWGAHVISSAPAHPSHHHYTARRSFFRYLGKGRYSLEPSLIPAR
jgi:hypothetical protein